MFDVAIVGGGPAGFAAAIAAKRALGNASSLTRPSRVAVFERAPSPDPPRGAVLAVVPNGVRALRAIDPPLADSVLALDLGVGGVRAELKSGEVLFEDESGRRADRTKHLGPSSLCTWHSLRKTLARRAEEVGVEVFWGCAFEGYEEEEEEGEGASVVKLRFSSSSSSLPSPSVADFSSKSSSSSVVSARLLVGADGSRSAVRAQIIAAGDGDGDVDGDEPAYSGTAAWRGVLRPLPPGWDRRWGWRALVGSQDDPGAARVVTYPVPLRKMMMATDDKNDSNDSNDSNDNDAFCLVWQIFARFPEARLPELSSRLHYQSDPSSSSSPPSSSEITMNRNDKIRRALEALGEGWPRELVDAVAATDASSVAEHGLYFREADEGAPWGRGNVTLVGDAAHLGTPLLGQGSSASFEDALALGHQLRREAERAAARARARKEKKKDEGKGPLLSGGGDVAAMLRRYEASRKPRATAIQRASVAMYKRQGAGERVDEIGEHLRLGFMEVEFESLV